MQRIPATIEEQLVSKAIKEECPWENLPKRLQATLNSKEDWHRRIIEHCIKKRLMWNTCFARKVCREAEYYEEMLRYLRRNLALFPYHLAEYVCRVMRVSPFRYYCDMLFEVMKNEQPYDSIPNFSAADALRLTGIGRNEFIDIMNKCRSKKIMWKLNKSIAKELLPTQPVDFFIEPWWGICLVNFTLEEFKKLTEEETATIDKICKEEASSYILFDPEIVKGLHRRGLVYFDVPVYPDDRFKVSRLEGFVSNREQSYEDPIEELLYAVFVVSSENSTVAELAATLQADLSQLQAAASFACRLGWAVKLIDPASILQDPNVPGSPKSLLSDEEDGSHASLGSANVSADGSAFQQVDIPWTENNSRISGYARVAFLVDANITSYLMMGSVSPGLKSHAVTLYEAGKLGHASIADLCKDLGTLEGTKFEGELQEFANHAFSLRCILECLTSDLFVEHHDAMQELRKRLRDVCAEYQATGPTAKFLYQKEQPKESSRHFMTYASGRWNPIVDPSSPISGVSSEHHRLKLARRQRSRTEVLSFDGNILRSYALTPVYEAATRPIEESPSVTTAKVEKDDAENKEEEIYPGVNLLFDGSELRPFEIGACLQARQPVSLIAEASATSAIFSVK